MIQNRFPGLRNPLFLGGLGFLALNLFLFGDVLLDGHRILSSPQADLFLHFAAWRQFGFHELGRGHLALWNPHFLCGAPFFGGFEAALLYPPNWLYMVLPLPLAINSGIVLHVFLTGYFTYLWCLYRGLRPLAGFTAGTVFMLGGAYFLHVYAGHLPNLCTMTWVPLLFLALDGGIQRPSLGWPLLGVFSVSMQILAGHPQYVYFTAILAFLYTGLNMVGKGFRPLANFAAVYSGACLVTAVQGWTGFQAVLECGRSIPLEYRTASSFSLPPENLLTLVFPDFFGSLSTPPYWGRWYLWEVSLFMGVGAFFLALLAIVEVDRRRRRWALTLAASALVLAMGAATPLYRFFYECVPFFKGFRGVCKFDFVASLFLAMLSGMGLDHLIRSKELPRWPSLLAALTAFLSALAGLVLYESTKQGLEGGWAQWFSSIHWLRKTVGSMDPPDRLNYVVESGLHAARSLWIGGGVCGLVSVLFRFGRRRPSMAVGMALLCICELLVFARANRPTFEFAAFEKSVEEVRGIYRRDPGDYRVYGTASLSLAAGGYDVWEDEPMVLGRYGRFICYSQGLGENQLFSTAPILKKIGKIFGMIRLKYLVSTDQEPFGIYPTPFKLLPRMRILNRWEVVPDGKKMLPILSDPAFDPGRKVLLEEPPGILPGPGKAEGTVGWKDLSTDAIEITADLPKAAILLITDNYSRGWKALAEPDSIQKNYRVLPADYILRAIPMAAGKHHLVLDYAPTAFAAGKWVSILSCLLYVVILIRFWKPLIFKRK